MFSIKDFKVTLLNKDEVSQFVKRHGEVAAICYNTNEKFATQVGESVLKTRHFSGSRGDYFKFKFENVPRDLIDQAVRHDVGTFKNVQSFRYVNKEGFNIYEAPEVTNDEILSEIFAEFEYQANTYYSNAIKRLNELGYSGEKANQIARHMIPIGTESAFVMGFTLEALINFMNKRLCVRAEQPIRELAKLMKKEVLEVAPIYAPYLVAVCDDILYCPEGKHSCGKRMTKEELLNALRIK